MKQKGKRRRGLAIVTIIVISAILLTIISVGLKIGSSGVLFVSQAHKRNVALAAAEAGVYQAIVSLQQDRAAEGTVSGDLSESGGSYTYELTNGLNSTRKAIVVSTGEFAGVRRTLKVELEPDSAGFQGVSLGGKVYIFDQAYFNAIASTDNPVARPGNAHSEYSAGPNSFVSGDYNGDGQRSRLHVTGALSARGQFDPNLAITSQKSSVNHSQTGYRLDKDKMLEGSFTPGSKAALRPGGTLSQNIVISGELEVVGKLNIPKGVTLHVKGDATFLGGLSGDGQVVVDGNALIRTDSTFDSSVKEGVKLCADGSVFVNHPKASTDDTGIHIPASNTVGDFFAQMPVQATYELSTNLPVDADKGGEFFGWFDRSVDRGDSDFLIWYNGNGTDIYPGLSEDTKSWLSQSRPIQGEIRSWAAANSGP